MGRLSAPDFARAAADRVFVKPDSAGFSTMAWRKRLEIKGLWQAHWGKIMIFAIIAPVGFYDGPVVDGPCARVARSTRSRTEHCHWRDLGRAFFIGKRLGMAARRVSADFWASGCWHLGGFEPFFRHNHMGVAGFFSKKMAAKKNPAAFSLSVIISPPTTD